MIVLFLIVCTPALMHAAAPERAEKTLEKRHRASGMRRREQAFSRACLAWNITEADVYHYAKDEDWQKAFQFVAMQVSRKRLLDDRLQKAYQEAAERAARDPEGEVRRQEESRELKKEMYEAQMRAIEKGVYY